MSEEVVAETEIPGGGRRGRLFSTLHWHHQNGSCVKISSDEFHLIVSLIVIVRRQCPQTTTFEERGKPNRGLSAYQPIGRFSEAGFYE